MKMIMKTKFESRDLDSYGAANPCQRRRREIFVAVKSKLFQSSVGATSPAIAQNMPLLRSLIIAIRYSAKMPHLRRFGMALLYFFILHSSFCLRASGQTYSIDWYKIAGGGGTSTNGQYAVSGTIGQHDAGTPIAGGNYSLTGGFWSLISVMQTSGAPTLYISHSGSTVTVYWQNVSGWSLQQNGNLSSSSGWTGSSGVTNANGTNYLNIASPTENLFFRLMQ